MPRNDVVPIKEMERRAPEAGRIRLGVKAPNTAKNARSKTRPASIGTFRFTSLHKDLIEMIAAQHGGTVSEWDDEDARYRHQWQVTSEANQIRVFLPENGLSQDLELWAHGGRLRKCDGITVETVQMVQDGTDYRSSPCICHAKGVRECQIKTRISVVLPNLPFLGVWRLDSGSWSAAHEIPGMFEMVAALQAGSPLVDCLLGVEQRTDRVAGKTRHYVVPTLGVSVTPLQIQAGMVNVQAIGRATAGEIGPVASETERPVLQLTQRQPPVSDSVRRDEAYETGNDDDDIADGEIVDDEETEPSTVEQIRDVYLRDVAAKAGLDPDRFVAGVLALAKPVEEVVADIRSGFIEPIGFTENGSVRWRQNTGVGS